MTSLNNTTNCTSRQSIFIKASEVCEVMEISRASAYRLIKQLNEELALIKIDCLLVQLVVLFRFVIFCVSFTNIIF